MDKQKVLSQHLEIGRRRKLGLRGKESKDQHGEIESQAPGQAKLGSLITISEFCKFTKLSS